MTNDTGMPASVAAALEAVARGYSPLPIHSNDKKPALLDWTRGLPSLAPDDVEKVFREANTHNQANIGLLLGAPSHDLIDIDLDHPKTRRLKEFFLPPTSMRSGRAGRPDSHYWYIAEPGTLQGYRKFTMPKKEDNKVGDVILEYRSTGGQSVIPPSIHPSGQDYVWVGQPWGGEDGPAVIDGKKLQVQVATLALCTVLLDQWPTQGSRHEAFLALAGGLLWYGERDVHPFWEGNVGVIIEALAEATRDEDGADARKAEVLKTTLNRIRDGRQTAGFGKLAEIIGDRHVKQARILINEVESAAGYVARQQVDLGDSHKPLDQTLSEHASELAAIPMEERDPLSDAERLNSWQTVDLEPYLSGRVRPVEPSVLLRDDGQALMYPGRVNMLYGSSESAKSWIALQVCRQVMGNGQRVVYLDLEDEPVNTLSRLMLLGSGRDDLATPLSFNYIRPEAPLAAMQRNRWGKMEDTPEGRAAQELFDYQLENIKPALIVADGMSVLYGLHGLNTNDTTDTDVITGWMKKLTRNGQTTVIVIDHTTKGAERGSMPIGSQHKVSMVQGSLLQVWPIKQPMPGALGKVELIVLKDRPGQVRKISGAANGKAQLAAEVFIDSRVPGDTVMTISAPAPKAQATNGDFTLSDAQRAKAEAQRVKEEQQRRMVHAISFAILSVFDGDVTRELTMREIVNEVHSRGDTWISGERIGKAVKAMHSPDSDDKALSNYIRHMRQNGVTTRWMDQIGATKNARYSVLVSDLEFFKREAVDLAKGQGGIVVDLSADAPLGAPMTIADDD